MPSDADLSVRALARHVAMSERSFQRLFTREIGVSPGRYVERVRIDTARRLLEQTDAGITGIARRAGFTTVETFHRAFRRLTGVTPTDYRQRFGRRVPDGADRAR